MEEQPIELHSEAVQDILGRVPPKILRWGTASVVVVSILLVAGTWLFRYPDIIESKIVITTTNPPAPLIARTSGKIAELRVTDKEMVHASQVLAIIQNPASFEDMERLRSWVAAFNPDTVTQQDSMFRGTLKLGEVQTDYAQFLKASEEFNSFMELKYYSRKIQLLEEEVSKYKIYIEQIQKQSNILAREVKLASRQFGRDSSMFRQGVISAADYEKAEASYLQKKYSLEEAGSQLTKAKLQLAGTDQQILDLRLQESKENGALRNALTESLEKLNGAVSVWDQTYVLRAPVEGKVTFNKYWSVNQTVTQGDRVMTVVPEGTRQMIGKLDLPVSSSGKVKPGQMINIKFDNFPYLEYGMVKGVLKDMSLVPANDFYSVEVSLPDSLRTNYGTMLPFNHEMQGTAEIITQNRRLLERLMNPMKSLIRKQQQI